MREKELKLLEILYDGKLSYNEILSTLNLRRDVLTKYLNDLKLNGYNWYKKFYSDGTTRFIIPDYTDDCDVSTSIITKPGEDTLKTLVFSDLHLGCTIERLDLLDRMFEYATKNGIHIMFGCGDLLDGIETRSAAQTTISNIYDQIDHLIKEYPYDKNILTFAVLGDHEGHASRKNSVDIAKIINNARNDLIVAEQPYSCISVKNEIIKLKHIIETRSQEKINIFGHTHKYTSSLHTNVNTFNMMGNTRIFDKSLMITAPSLSNGNQGIPSMLELDIDFDNGFVSEATVKELGFLGRENRIIKLSEINYDLFMPEVEDKPIYNVEDYMSETPKKIKKITK